MPGKYLDQVLVSRERETQLLGQAQHGRIVMRHLQAEAGEVFGECVFKPCEKLGCNPGVAPVLGNAEFVDLDDVARILIAPEENDGQRAFLRFPMPFGASTFLAEDF